MIRGKITFILCVAVLVLSIGIFSLSQVKQAQAQSLGLLPFGGYITGIFYCTATHNFLLSVAGVNGGTFVYDPNYNPQIYESYNLPRTGIWVLGLYDPNPLGCWQQAAPSDIPIYSTGIMSSTVGTSPAF